MIFNTVLIVSSSQVGKSKCVGVAGAFFFSGNAAGGGGSATRLREVGIGFGFGSGFRVGVAGV